MSDFDKNPQYKPTTFEGKLGYLIEECGETLAAAGKTLRWGVHSFNPELPPEERETNIDWLQREMADLRKALDMLQAEIDGWP